MTCSPLSTTTAGGAGRSALTTVSSGWRFVGDEALADLEQTAAAQVVHDVPGEPAGVKGR
jgi:hypothetical protein